MTSHQVSPARPLSTARLLAVVTGLLVLVAVALVLSNVMAAVPLLAGDGVYGRDTCFLNWAEGELVVDRVAGTAITIGGDRDNADVRPVKWPAGYTGRRAGSQIEVLDRNGEVVARTGSRYHIAGGYEGDYWLTCNERPTPLP